MLAGEKVALAGRKVPLHVCDKAGARGMVLLLFSLEANQSILQSTKFVLRTYKEVTRDRSSNRERIHAFLTICSCT